MTTTPTGSPDEPLCERCEKFPVSKDCEEGLYCIECLANIAEDACEAAYERQFTDYWEGNGPLSLDEQHEAAWREKRGLR